MSEWQPISTAPKDGTRIMLWDSEENQAVTGRWNDDCTVWHEITHWMPLPEPPNE